MLWIAMCIGKPDQDAIREPYLQAHRDYLDDHVKKGILIFSGPRLTDDGKEIIGSMFIINVRSADEARAFSANEPYTKAGIYASVTLTRVRKGRWNPAAVEPA